MTKKFDLKPFFEKISIANPINLYKNIVILPLKNQESPSTNYISLKRALDENLAELKEVDAAGIVPEISVINKSKHFILIPQGEQLVGAKQNRIVNTTILLEPETKTKIPVSCIEQGRWHYVRQNFLTGNEVLAYKMRKTAHKTVVNNLMRNASFRADQYEIWDYILSEFEKDGLHSRTSSYSDYMKSKIEQERIEDKKFNLPENINGFAFYVGTKLISIEYFSNPEFFRENGDRIVKAMIVDAQDYSELRLREDFDYKFDLIGRIGELINIKQISKKSIGVGDDYKGIDRDKNIEFSFLVYDNNVIHFVSFF